MTTLSDIISDYEYEKRMKWKEVYPNLNYKHLVFGYIYQTKIVYYLQEKIYL